MKPSRFFASNCPAPVKSVFAVAVLLGAGAFCQPALAEIYGWTDASGVTTYSDQPPPKGARLTDVIHETPMSPEALAEAAHRSDVSQLNDRIRLLELELERQKRAVVDYPAPPPQAAGLGCGPGGYAECDPAYDYSPYYTTGLFYPGYPGYLGNYYPNHDFHGHRPNSGGHTPHRGPPSSPRMSRASTGHASAAGPQH